MTFKKGIHPSPKTEFKKGCIGYNKGKHFSEESKKRMSLAQKGHKVSEETRRKMALRMIGDKNPMKNKEIAKKQGFSMKGRKFSEEHKTKLSGTRKRLFKEGKLKVWIKGCGGKSFEPYGIKFNNKLREQIRIRDNHRCQECFRHQSELRTKTNKNRKLVIHHIDYNKKNNEPSNLISLCLPCHIKTNFKRENWINYFQRRIM